MEITRTVKIYFTSQKTAGYRSKGESIGDFYLHNAEGTATAADFAIDGPGVQSKEEQDMEIKSGK